METLAFPFPPWPDLPDHLLEDILERLPLSSYVRFPAVCRRWRSVQTSHRRRHSPSPPPMLRLPWLVLTPYQETLTCFSPFEGRIFSFPLHSFAHSHRFIPFLCGWFLNWDPCDLALFNPVSAVKIQLPRISSLPGMFLLRCVFGLSPPPNYIVSAVGPSSIFLLRWFDSSWIKLELPAELQSFDQTVSISGKHYCILYKFCKARKLYSVDLLVVDALATPPTFQYFEMSGLTQIARETWLYHRPTFLVELGEEPLFVKVLKEIVDCGKNRNGTTVGFDVFRADLCRKMWVKVESIGCDRVLMLHWLCYVSLLAADIGARGNCIYFATGSNLPSWKVFDLGTGRMSYSQLLNDLEIGVSDRQFFVPALC